MKVKVTTGKEKKITCDAKELIGASIEEIVESKIKEQQFNIVDVSFSGNKCVATVSTGETKVVDIDEESLIDKSIKQIVKEKLKLKSLKNISIQVIKPGK
jgi:hypothetical protein